MSADIHPCIIYQRLRPSAPRESEIAEVIIFPWADQLAAREGYTVCGLYGDSEFAPPFCGGSEIRPGYEAALDQAKSLAAQHGLCTLIIGNAAPIGDGDPFVPAYVAPEDNGNVRMQLINTHLLPQAELASLCDVWNDLNRNLAAEREDFAGQSLDISGAGSEIEVHIHRVPERLLARLYLANPLPTPLVIKWRQLSLPACHSKQMSFGADWSDIVVPNGRALYLDTVFQGAPSWVRQLRFRGMFSGRKAMGVLHLVPSDMVRDKLALTWEDRA